MAVAKRQRKGKAHENGTKENPKMGMRTSGETNSPPGYPTLHRAGSGGGGSSYKKSIKYLNPSLKVDVSSLKLKTNTISYSSEVFPIT